MRVSTMRRSRVSLQRDTRPRFSNRSKSRVISESRVIILLPISPQASPSGAPRRIRRTLYCVGEISAAFSTGSSRRARRSPVCMSFTKTCSSRTPGRRVALADLFAAVTSSNNTRYNECSQSFDAPETAFERLSKCENYRCSASCSSSRADRRSSAVLLPAPAYSRVPPRKPSIFFPTWPQGYLRQSSPTSQPNAW